MKQHELVRGMTGVSNTLPDAEPTAPLPEGEPVPNWETARQIWKSTWGVHVYGFASIFLAFAFVSAYRFLKLYSLRSVRTYSGFHLKLCLYLSLLLFSLLRSLLMFGDAYNSCSIIPEFAAKILWSLALPCLIYAFTVLLAVLLATTNACHRGRSPTSSYKHGIGMGGCLLLYTALVIAADWAVMYSHRSIFLLIVCQVFFVVWGTVVMIGYAMVAFKIFRDLSRTPLNVDRSLLRSFARLLVLCAVVGFACVAVKFYSAVAMVIARSPTRLSPDPWPWLAFQSVQRLLECSICALLILITGRADRKRKVQIVPKIMCNGVTIISGLENGVVMMQPRLTDMYRVT